MVLVCNVLMAQGCQVQPLNGGVLLKFPSRSHHALLLKSPSDVKIVCGKVGARSHNGFYQLLIDGAGLGHPGSGHSGRTGYYVVVIIELCPLPGTPQAAAA